MKKLYTLLTLAIGLVTMSSVAQDTYMVTFNVNMMNETVAETGVFLAGGGDSCFGVPGSAASYELTDPDEDGTYSVTIEVESGFTCPYTFTNGECADFGCKENIIGQDCAVGEFNDRLLDPVTEDTVISTCFSQCSTDGTCEEVGGSVPVTFQVNMTDVTDAFTIPELNGTFNGWCGNCNPLTDQGGGVWSTTVDLAPGFYEYKFSADAWGIQEELGGIPGDCTLTSGEFTNRVYTVEGTDPIVLDAVCWQSCVNCDSNIPNVTFRVDMSLVTDAFTTPEVNGTFNGWCGNCNAMTDMGNGIWETTIALAEGSYQYKFSADTWTIQEELGGIDGDCTVADGDFTNRGLEVGTEDVVLDIVCWMSCEACADGVGELDGAEISVYPNPASGNTVNIQSTGSETITVYNALGEQVATVKTNANSATSLDISEFVSGLYFIKSENGVALSQFIVQR